MSWETECVEIVRVLIDDIDTVQKYDDSRIERVLIVAAQQLIQEIQFTVSYTVLVTENSISPDPVENRDNAFITLLTLKTALLIVQGELRKYALSSVKIVDGPSTIDMTAAFNSLKDLFDNLNQKYEKEKMVYTMGVSGQIVTGPTTYWSYTDGPLGRW